MNDFCNNNILSQFLFQCLRSPNNIYLSDENGEVTFFNLLCKAFSISELIIKRLIDVHCINQPIAILLPRGINCVSSFYASWMTSNFYVPIDPKWPMDRINNILSELNPVIIIHDHNISSNLIDNPLLNNIYINISEIDEEVKPDVNSLIDTLNKKIRPEDPCYCIYTSGSTGKPKGVLISHRSLFNYIQWFTYEFKLDESSCFGSMSQFYFDISAVDIFVPTFTAGVTHIIPSQNIKFPVELLKFINIKSINSVMWVPSALSYIASSNALNQSDLSNLKNIFFAGEPLSIKILNIWRQKLPYARFINMYGPTEATITCTYYEVPKNFQFNSIPIGKSSPPSTVFLLEGFGQNVSDIKEVSNFDQIGEICVGGEGIAIGYWRNQSETQKRFINNPLNHDYFEKIYRTGDLGKYDKDRNLIFCGRIDSQIKHHGYRIELSEIEIVAQELSEITNSCALYIPERSLLILAVESSIDSLAIKNISSFLKSKLPHYMIPSIIKIFTQFPLLSTGKVDKKRILESFFV